MRKTRENVEKMKRESLEAVYTSSFSEIINYFRKRKKLIINESSKEQLPLNKRGQAAVTLVALVVTIVVLILLAGVSINLVIGNNGIMQKALKAKENMEQAAKEEQEGLSALEERLNSLNTANAPVLLTGMTPIKFTTPTDTKMGETIETTADDADWYSYGVKAEEKKWANAKTQDGSMWVWIPRFAYRVDNDKKIIDVVFLQSNSDEYYDENGNLQTAKRQKSIDETIDTTTGYTVHPAFTDESSIKFANGGWDKELTGIWVAKFDAGYASGNNTAEVKASSVSYSPSRVWTYRTERGTATDDSEDARNWLDGIYGSTKTSIKYPTFQGVTYAMNYINHNDSFNIAKVLNESGNIYGLSTSDSDSHLMKNSEWGACSYLSLSKYGLYNVDIKINSVNLNSGNRKRTENSGKSGVDSVYAVTGCAGGNSNTTIDTLKAVTANKADSKGGAYVWNQKNGQASSTTGTIYGVYDMSGTVWERTAAYVANGNGNLRGQGSSIAYNGNTLKTESTKYTTVYPFNEEDSKGNKITNIDTASQQNFVANSKIYGDAVRETNSGKAGTSASDWYYSSWTSDCSYFPALNGPFFLRGGHFWSGSRAGVCAFYRDNGNSSYNIGFRAVLVNK